MARDGFDFGSFCGDFGKALTQQWDRSTRELNRNLGADMDRVIDKTKNEGFLQGGLELMDLYSMGNLTVEVGSAFNVIPDDPALKEAISGGVNLVSQNPIGWVVAAKDAFEAIAACTNPSPAAVAAMPTAAQTPMSPEEAKQQAIEAAKERARGRVHDKVERAEERVRTERLMDELVDHMGERDGYCCGGVSDGMGKNLGELLKLVRELCGKDKTDRAGDEIDRLLAEGNLCFEDLMFLLMRKVIKEGQDEAKGLADELDGVGARDRGDKGQWNEDIASLRAQLVDTKDPATREQLATKLQAMAEKRDLDVDERAESRAELAEKLKYTMQKLGEMEQALSNILNTQHETAMGAIRNIR
ncbi:MAG: hypothetical protein IT383_21805 [Deltaproteobacteria bacterium]|nr:hypothetical protein [Deltaproteobacteria bacterium]